MREKKDTRVFFALWPDDAVRGRLARIAGSVPLQRPARRVPDHNLHLTLHFVGDVSFAERDCLREAAFAARGEAFELVVDIAGFFARPRIGWLGCGEMPAELDRLHQALGQALKACDYRPERRPYRPHVTFARKLAHLPAMPEFEPLAWPVDEFALIESRAGGNGVKYAVIETYPFA